MERAAGSAGAGIWKSMVMGRDRSEPESVRRRRAAASESLGRDIGSRVHVVLGDLASGGERILEHHQMERGPGVQTLKNSMGLSRMNLTHSTVADGALRSKKLSVSLSQKRVTDLGSLSIWARRAARTGDGPRGNLAFADSSIFAVSRSPRNLSAAGAR